MPDSTDLAALREFEDSPIYYGFFGMVFAVMTSASMFSPYSTLGVPGAVVLGAYSLWLFRRALFPQVRIRVTEEGVIDESRSPGLIEWREVIDVHRSRWGQIDIKVRDEAAILERMSPLTRLAARTRRLLGYGAASLSCWALTPDTESIFRALEDGMDQHALRTMNAEHQHSLAPSVPISVPRPSPLA